MANKNLTVKPILSEKSTLLLTEQNIYTFLVARNVGKIEVKQLLKKAFNVNADRINFAKNPGKKRRRGRIEGFTSDKRKAYVKLKDGEKIDEYQKLV